MVVVRRESLLGGRKIFVDHEGDAPLRLFEDAIAFLRLSRQSEEHEQKDDAAKLFHNRLLIVIECPKSFVRPFIDKHVGQKEGAIVGR